MELRRRRSNALRRLLICLLMRWAAMPLKDWIKRNIKAVSVLRHLNAWHLSVEQRTPKLRKGQARPDQLDDAAESPGKPGGSASGDFSGLIGGTFFSLGVG